MGHFRDRARFIVPPLDGVQFLLSKRDNLRPSKRRIGLAISENHPVNALTKGIIKAWHEGEKDPCFRFSKLLTFSLYAKHEIRCRFINAFPHGIERCLLLLLREPEFLIDSLLKERPAEKENACLALPKAGIIQLAPAGLTDNDRTKLVEMVA